MKTVVLLWACAVVWLCLLVVTRPRPSALDTPDRFGVIGTLASTKIVSSVRVESVWHYALFHPMAFNVGDGIAIEFLSEDEIIVRRLVDGVVYDEQIAVTKAGEKLWPLSTAAKEGRTK